jgi:hypothetical protein
MKHKKIGYGTLSIILSILGILWSFSINNVCIGDLILNSLGVKTWSETNTGIHYTVFYSCLFFVAAFIIATLNKKDFGAKLGRVVSAIVIAISVLSVFELAI